MTADITELARCSDCGEQWADPTHQARCAYRTAVLTSLIERAVMAEVSEVKVRDLFAHLLAGSDYERTARAVGAVLDLGWRPVIGVNPSP